MSQATQRDVIEFTSGWQVAEYGDGPAHDRTLPVPAADGWIDAVVPGAVQYDLIRAGKLGNPYASSEAVRQAEWVHKTDWLYRQNFAIDLSALAEGELFIDADGVDTFSEFWLNGQRIGETRNAYRSYRFAIPRDLLKADGNVMLVHVKAHERMVADMIPEAKRRLGATYKLKGLVRRYQRSFFGGSSLLNLGGEVLGIGLFKPLRLVIAPAERVADVHFQVLTASARKATAKVHVELAGAMAGRTLRVSLTPEGATGAAVSATASAVGGVVDLEIADPQLWWPAGYGAQPLYTLRVELCDGDTVLSADERRVGLRSVQLLQKTPSGRNTFKFLVNEAPIYVRGQNLIPLDYIKVHGQADEYERLLTLVGESNTNLIRIWGGGAIESDGFYERCDELGILLWQDFYLHSNTYPDYDEAWVAEFRAESEGLVRRLRNHPALVLLCGGNEQYEGWDEWGWRGLIDRFYGEKLLTEVLPEVSADLCSEIPYILNSPHGGVSSQTPIVGDGHVWGNFYNATKDPLFVTETCWSQQSYSTPQTLESMMGLKMSDYSGTGWPHKWKEQTGLDLIARLPYTGGPIDMDDLRGYLKSLEIEQAVADYLALAQFRHASPSCSGVVYWSLNKGGPLFQFGCIDYLGHPLASYYTVKRIYAPVTVGIYRDGNDIRVIGSNRTRASFVATLSVRHLRADGTVIKVWMQPVELRSDGNARLIDLADYYEAVVDRAGEILVAELHQGNTLVYRDTLFFCPLIDFVVAPNTVTPRLAATGDQSWEVSLTAGSVVKMVYLEGNGKWLCDDNYFVLLPGETRVVKTRLLQAASAGAPQIDVCVMNSTERHELVLGG